MTNPQDIVQGQSVFIASPDDLRAEMRAAYEAAGMMLEEGGCEVILKPLDARTAEQNRRMWAMLNDISRQVNWHGTKLTAEEWKDVLTASLKRQKAVPGLDGGFVVVGGRTSKMSKKLHSELMELASAFGAEHRVAWSDPKWASYGDERRAA